MGGRRAGYCSTYLVDEEDLAIGVDAKLVLGVHEQETVSESDFLAVLEEGEGFAAGLEGCQRLILGRGRESRERPESRERSGAM